ncbi:MAG: DUF2997 domain-containing protein [Pirellulaceae bacterium]|nr:DUF2997 domain-containing protein [Pirellulaceae bacterium]
MKKMRIRIKTDGKTTIQVEGATGDECLDFTRLVEQALGEVEDRVRTCEPADPLQVDIREELTESETESF